MTRTTRRATRLPDTRTPRQRAFDRLYAETHSDFKGVLPDGTRSVMSWAKFGGRLATIDTITDAELAERGGLVLAPMTEGAAAVATLAAAGAPDLAAALAAELGGAA